INSSLIYFIEYQLSDFGSYFNECPVDGWSYLGFIDYVSKNCLSFTSCAYRIVGLQVQETHRRD
ncbi:14904_t:CDS:1, partial [Entrophospora sp. SA101]